MTLAMADNAGSHGMTNSWVLPLQADGSLPGYVALLPPAYWSGTLSGLELTVLSGETSLSDLREDTTTFDLVIDAQADGLAALEPGTSNGREGSSIALNLNAIMVDGLAGNDTVWLRYGEDIDFDQPLLLKNIETIDLTRAGFDHGLSNLSAADVLQMTDSRRVLTIDADTGDQISFKAGEDWSLDTAASVPGYDVYVNTVDAGTRVEVRITQGFATMDDLLDALGSGSMAGRSAGPAPDQGAGQALLDALDTTPKANKARNLAVLVSRIKHKARNLGIFLPLASIRRRGYHFNAPCVIVAAKDTKNTKSA